MSRPDLAVKSYIMTRQINPVFFIKIEIIYITLLRYIKQISPH